MPFYAQKDDAAINAELGGRIRQARLDHGFSQEALAAKAGIHRTSVSLIERGSGSLKVTTLIRILEALDLLDSLDQLIPRRAPSPIDRMRREDRERQRSRASRPSPAPEKSKPWRWGDEEGGPKR